MSNEPSKLVTITQLAHLLDVDRAAVSRAIDNGRIRKDALHFRNGRKYLDEEMALADFKNNKDESKDTSKGAVFQPGVRPVEGTLVDFKIKEQKYKAEKIELEVKEKKKELVSVEKVRKEASSVGKIIMENLLNIPDRLGYELAAETDPDKVSKMLDKEIRKCLKELSKKRF